MCYWLLYLLVPKGIFLYEGLRLPFWLLKLRRQEKPGPPPTKIKYGSHFRQYLLFFQPPADTPEKQYVVLYFHGSGWQYGRPELFTANAQWLTKLGHPCFFVSHRRIPQCDVRQLREDTGLAIRAAMDYLRAQGLGHKKILLSGNSAGGHLCALALLDPRVLAPVGLDASIFSALALLAAPLDLRVMWPSPPLLMLTRLKNTEIFQLANPVFYLNAAIRIPTLLLHGNKDGVVEYQNALVFHQKLRELNTADLEFHTLEGGMHLDSASWCMEGHACCEVFGRWLGRIEESG